MSRLRSSDLTNRLSERDWQILTSVRAFRYLTTRQLARQHFGLKTRSGIIPRNANHSLARLRDLDLLVNLERRIGGVRAGSGGHIWQITDLGHRLLRANLGEQTTTRTRTYEPGTTFLDHTLAIAEVVITLQEATCEGDVTLKHVELEPQCWRTYLGPLGDTKWLKPDLGVVTAVGKYEDHWFLEVDRATEPPNRIIKKCLQYQEYRRTDVEQGEHGLFPAVVWVVPNQRRREQLRRHLADERALDLQLFTVVVTDELSELATLGAKEFNNQRGEQATGPQS
jgi:hypothetical protein